MGLNAVVGADFSAFTAAIAAAEIKTNDMARAGKNAARDLTTMVYALDGTKVMREAELAAEAIRRVEGVSRLTAAEAARMSAPINEAVAKYKAMGQEVPPHLAATSTALAGVTTGNTSVLSSVKTMAAGYVTGMLTLQAAQRVFQELTGFVKESIAASAEAGQVQQRLASALTNTRQPVAAVSAAFNDFARHMEVTTTLSAGEVVSVMALATEMGVTAGQMGRLIQVSANLSSAWKVGLEEAMSLVVKGGEGMTKAFKAHNIEMDATRAAAEGLAYVLPELEGHFGSNAADQLDTYAGRVTALGVAWGNFKEAVGGVVTSGGVVEGSLGATTLAVRGLSEVIEKHGVMELLRLGLSARELVPTLVSIGGAATLVAAQVKSTGVETASAGDKLAEMAKRVSDLLNPALEKLTPVQQSYIDQMAAANIQQGDMAKALGVSEAAIRSYLEGVKDSAKAQKEAFEATKKWNEVLNDIGKTTHALAVSWQSDVIEAAKETKDAINASIVSQLDALTAYQRKNELALLSGTELKLRQLEIEQAAELQKNQVVNGANKELYALMVAEIETYFARQREAVVGGADHFVAQIGRETQAVQQAAMTWSQAMSAVQRGEGAMTGSVQNAPLTDETRRATQSAWASGNYYGPVLGGSQANPRGFGPDWEKLGYGPGGSLELRATGGPVTAGSPYLVGERGAELFVPGSSGTIVPHGSLSQSVTVAPGAVVLQFPLMNDPRALGQIADLFGTAILTKMRDAGWRPPAGS